MKRTLKGGMTQTLSQLASAARAHPYMDGLNEAQLEAVETIDGPVLVLAGAGTGKTRALTTRIAHILHQNRARPFEILAVTFTNKAAREMQNRIGSIIGPAVTGMPWLGTFHSVCVKILRRHAELVGLRSSFVILDMDDQLRLIKQLLKFHDIDEKRWPAKLMASLIDRWKNRALTPDKLTPEEKAQFNGFGQQIYAEYQARLRTLNAVDFGDLLLLTIELFKNNGDILAEYHQRFKYILVDEYQDTNVAQYLWLRLLAQGSKNICCVGDDDQSIYGWRGAEVGNILKFERDFEGAKLIRLEQNYRSTPHILAAAGMLISSNEKRLGKTLWTTSAEGEKVRLIGHWDGEEEARWVGEDIEDLQRGTRGRDKMSLENVAILVRASHQMRAFEDRFLTIGVPYRVIGGPRFYERLEIRDAMAYFRLAISQDDDLAFERIVNTPKRGLGEKALQTINVYARENHLSLFNAAHKIVIDGGFSTKARQALREFCDLIITHAALVQAGDDHIEIAQTLLDGSGYTTMWQQDKSADAPGRLDNLKELVKALENFENLQGFLEHVSLVMDNNTDESDEKVSIMTLHGSKGLEFPAVYLPGWEEGLFPSQRTLDESGLRGLEEERRLAYVGITRAEQLLTISFAANRRIYNQWQNTLPSRFIDELPADHVEVLSVGGVYAGNGKIPQSDMMDRAASTDAYNAPGWKRMKQNATPQSHYNKSAGQEFEIGEKVFHQKFGYGYITRQDGEKCSVEFEHSGEKNLMSQYLSRPDDIPF